MPFQPRSHHGTLHHYTSRLTAFEHVLSPSCEPLNEVDASAQASSKILSSACHNYILFLGGLGDGFCTVNYPHILASALLASEALSRWRVVEVLLSSSYSGWTTSSLARDAAEVTKCVAYFRSLQASSSARRDGHEPKIILMGHSTGCQIGMEYLVGPSTRALAELERRPRVDGVILQAAVSDREGILAAVSKEQYDYSCKQSTEWMHRGKGDDVLGCTELPEPAGSLFGKRPTANRWLSLAGPDGPGTGDDDYFSMDVPREILAKTFGALDVPVCVLISGDDEHMASWVPKEDLLEMWHQVVTKGSGKWSLSSGVVAEASHNLNRSKEGAVSDLIRRTGEFVNEVQLNETKQVL